MATIFWLIAFVAFLIIEIITLGLTTVWFAIGSIAAFLAAYVGASIVVQIVVFLVVSIVFLVFTRPILMKFFNQKRERTNAESLIGQKALVLEKIDSMHATGRVIVNGMEWAAKTEEEEIIEVDAVVLIKGIQGVKLIVEKEEV
jgi:membrane protein implicated in regulation of membrane protease activity